MDYRFEEYSPRYKAQIASLRSRTFGGDLAFSTEYFEWKYERNPYLEEPHFYVALHGEDVVAMRGFYGTRWQTAPDSESLLIPIGGDLAVDHEHRRQKLASRMMTYITGSMERQGYQYLMNLSANASSRRLQIRSGYPRVVPFCMYQRGAPGTTILARGYEKAKRLLIRPRRSIPFKRFDQWAAKSKGSIIGASQPRVDEMAELVRRYGDDPRIHLVRDATFYQWRFMNPASEYRFIYSQTSESLDGFLVLRSAKAGGWTTIIDWQTSTPAVWTKLIRTATRSNRKRLRITTSAFTEEELRTLSALGFDQQVERDSADQPAPGLLLHLSSDHDETAARLCGLDPFDARNWELRMIASDAF